MLQKTICYYIYKCKFNNSTLTFEVVNNLPITLFAKDLFFNVASPKSPIFTDPVGPVMKILSHFKSLCIT